MEFGTYLIVLGVAVICAFVVVPRLLRRRSGGTPRLGSFEAEEADLKNELQRLLTDVQELSREQIAKLDTKIRMLNQLLLECDQKKKELETLLGRAVGTLPRTDPLRREPEGEPAPTRPVNPLHDQVYSLQDSGKDLHEICSATGLEKGEVELILGLRKMAPRK